MDFKQLEAFVNVAKYKSFSKAGKALYLSQPTISLHISNLEKDLGIVLFDRNSKEVNLTSMGIEFLNYAQELINMKNKALQNITKSELQKKGLVQIATSMTPNLLILPKAIQTYRKCYPEVNFKVEEKNSSLILDDIFSLYADIGLVCTHVENDRFISTPILKDELVFVTGHNSKIPKVITSEALSDFPIIHRSEQSTMRKNLESVEGFDFSNLKTAVETDNLSLVQCLVSSGVGFSYVSKKIYEDFDLFSKLKTFKIESFDYTYFIEVVINRRRTLPPAVEDFMTLLINDYISP